MRVWFLSWFAWRPGSKECGIEPEQLKIFEMHNSKLGWSEIKKKFDEQSGAEQ